ncbi:hypothetical protein IAG25_15865 [Caballeronia sp. EK]|uniref:hypothetical protein n=1 Tax=Caballeronia sp. EK TaxID=2767469 RepID=UPI001654F859|nr:hypothetical protein [Caballeronia sp. EK]MBC8638297.1 hypothetical protein [Caballeronia sp. EK]
MSIYYSSDVLVTEFRRFARANVPPDADDGQLADMQRAFFGGMLVMLNIEQAIADLPEELACVALECLHREAISFAKAQVVISRMSQEPSSHD